MQARDFDAYRPHAEATSALTLSLPPTLSSAPREDTIKAMNRLRLTMYINHVDSSKPTLDIIDDAAAIKIWIETHTPEVQVFLNALGAGIPEDGIRGDLTVNCIQKLLGITTVSVLITPEPPVTGVIVPPVTTTILRPVARPTNSDDTVTDNDTVEAPEETETVVIPNGNDAFTPEQMINMRRTILSDPHLKGELEKIGVRFVRNKDTGALDMILPEAFESTPEYRQLQTYIKALHMTTDPEYTNPLTLTDEMRREKMEMFFEIIRGSGDHIQGREFLAYKLINSINEDLKRDPRGPYVMTRSGEQGEYGIFKFPISRNPSTYKISSSRAPQTLPYHELLTAGNISDDYIEFATTYSLIESNHVAFQGREFLGQATLVNRILSNHGIDGVSEEDVQDGNLLIADWDVVVKDIDAKILALSTGNEKNIDAYQELMYVKDLIEGKEWMAEDRTKDIFREMNTFGKAFLQEKSLIDDAMARLGGSGTDETTGEMIRNIAKENLFGLPGLLALFIAIFNIGGLGKAAGIGLLGAAGAMAGGSIIDSITDRTGDPLSGTNGGENLELVRIRQLQYGIKGGDALNATLSNLYKENDRRNENSRKTQSRDLFVQEPLVLGKILFEVSESNDLSTLDLSDNNLAVNIFTQMNKDGNLAVDGTEFTSNISRNPTITQTDVNAFVEILRSQTDEGVDTTLGDVLVAGDIDRLNHEYDTSWYTFTENSDVNQLLHNQFILLWGTNNTGGSRDKREAVQEILEKFDETLFSGAGDAASTAWVNSATISAGVSAVAGTATGISVDDRKLKIAELTAYMNTNPTLMGSPIIKQALLDAIEEYKTLLEESENFEALKNNWYEGPVGTRIQFQDLTKWFRSKPENETNLEAIRTEVAGNVTALTSLEAGLPTSSLFDSLKTEIQAEITYLNNMDDRAINKLVALADFAAVSSGTGLDITQDINLAKVTTVAQGIQDELRESIELRTGNLFWNQAGVNIAAEIVKAYDEAKATAGTASDISKMAGIDLWNNIHGGIVSSLGLVPKYGTVVSSAVTAYLPSPIHPTTGQVNVLDARTIRDIEAQIKLGLVRAYLTEQQENIQNYQRLEDIYTAAGPDKLPAGVPQSTSSGTVMTYPSDTPEQTRLRAILTTEHEALLQDIQNQITIFAESYDGAAQVPAISALPNTIDITTIEQYQNVATFLHNSANLDTEILAIRKLAADSFVNTPNLLDATLITVAELKGGNPSISFDGFDTKLSNYITAVEADTLTDETVIPISTVPFIDIEKNIKVLKAVQGLIGGPGNSADVDRALGLWEIRRLEVATVNQIPEVKNAIDTDIISLGIKVTDLNNRIAREAGLGNPTSVLENEKHEVTALLAVLNDAIRTPRNIDYLKLALGHYTDNDGNPTRPFTGSYITIDETLLII